MTETSSRLIIKNISKSIIESQLKEKFLVHGDITDIKIMKDASGKSRGFAFVGFRNSDCAEAAKTACNNTYIGTLKVAVAFATPIARMTKSSVEAPATPYSKTDSKPMKAIPVASADFVETMSRKKGVNVWMDDNNLLNVAEQKPSTDEKLDDLAYLKRHVVTEWDSDSEAESPTSEEQIDVITPSEQPPTDSIEDHGRLIVANIPYNTTRVELESFFTRFGSIRDIHICLDDGTKLSRGFAFVSFAFPDDAVKVLNGPGLVFEGRNLKIKEASTRSVTFTAKLKEKLSFKEKRENERRETAETSENTWNLLYISSNSAASSMAEKLSVTKSDILSHTTSDDNIAVRAAIAETEIIRQTADWLKSEGLAIEAFQAKGASLVSAQLQASARSDTILVAKHLPAGSLNPDNIRIMFQKCGELVRFSMSPSKTVAVVEYADSESATRAFKKLAFRRVGSVPLYLEKAPISIVTADADRQSRSDQNTKKTPVVPSSEVSTSRLLIRNVAFEANQSDLRKLFEQFGNVTSIRLPNKIGEKQHRGFAFVEFASKADAQRILEDMRGTHLYGRRLVIEPAETEPGSKRIKTI